ncbi:MAG: 3-phosphoshikimate 1-carboxyvinyltransferase, partial [Clostridia bacterium]|nr:3-phosphoshikimate 1-carboxyvinyltransferase [Clostridia bacterium]
ELRAVSIPEDIIPRIIDEIPVLAVAAALAEGTSVFRGVEELKFKESNRLYTVVTELRRLGARADWGEGELRVEGPVRLKGARCYSHGDHRIAMSLAVAALAAKGSTVIEGAECISVSFPTFADTLAELRTDN